MAHLIKLEDYISRYQFDIQRYPNQFTRMKKERWYYLKNEWEQYQNEMSVRHTLSEMDPDPSIDTNEPFLQKIKRVVFSRSFSQRRQEPIDSPSISGKKNDPLVTQARTLEQLKELYLEDLFSSQLRWASSSLLEQSSLHPKYKRDPLLRFFTKHLPDNFFIMYYPVFWIKQAPIDMEIILVSPSEIYCIAILEGSSKHSVFEASTNRFWIEYVAEEQKRVLSPIVSLNRMTAIIQEIMNEAQCQMPIKKLVLSKDHFIDHHTQSIQAELIDKRNFPYWHEKWRKHPSPIKSQQLKVTKALLESCQTKAYKRQDITVTGQ